MDTFIKQLRTASSADVRLVISDQNWLESTAVEQLKKTAELPGMCCGVGMPDLHPGKGQPIGAAFVTRDRVYPHLVGSDIGCGMGLWQLDTLLRQVKLDKWEKRLVDLDDPWCEEDAILHLQEYGAVAPCDSLNEGNNKLGTIGGGNHFAEIQAVHEIVDEQTLSAMGLSAQSVVLLVHSGSRGIGQRILRSHIDVHGASGLKGGQPILRQYIEQHDYAVQWATVNRQLIAQRFCERLKVKKRPLLDVSHNTVTPLEKDAVIALGLVGDNDKPYWIHRKGASPTDQGLVMIPGSRGSLSYLVKPKSSSLEPLAVGGFSLAHGAGRKWQRGDSKVRLQKRFKVKDLEVTEFGSRVICKQRSLLYEEAPQAYKNVTTVVDDLVQAGMIDIVASFKPLITYKTRRTS